MRSRTLLVAAVLGLAASPALAVPYASAITDLGGGDYSFVLNQDADVVVVYRSPDTPLILGPLAKGTHTFNIGEGTGFEIYVSTSEGEGWTQISVDEEVTSFYSPRGIAINKNPAASTFGHVYVSNAVAGTTGFGRDVQDGIYLLDAAITDLGFYTGGVDWTGDSAPWKSTIGPDNRLYVCHYSNDELYELSDDLSSATLIIGADHRFELQFVEAVWVEGTRADRDRVVYAVNSNYNDWDHKGVIEYVLGDASSATGLGTQYISEQAYSFYPYDAVRDSNGDWYTSQYRWYADQAPPIRKFDGAGTVPIGDDPNEILWEADMSFNGGYNCDIYERKGCIAYGSVGAGTGGSVNFFDLETGGFLESFPTGMTYVRDLAFDVAGNLYAGDSSSEWLRVFSPGGTWIAATGSDGTFAMYCAGDLDGDDDIDLADLAALLANYASTGDVTYTDGDLDLDGDVDLSDLAALLAVYGSTCS